LRRRFQVHLQRDALPRNSYDGLLAIITPNHFLFDLSDNRDPDIVDFERMAIVYEAKLSADLLSFCNRQSSSLIWLFDAKEHAVARVFASTSDAYIDLPKG
jgi:hypothetical protein